MKSFPDILTPDKKDEFKKIINERNKCYLRRDLYEHILSSEEKEYFDIDDFCKRRNISYDTCKLMVEGLRSELHKLGWKTDLSFGGTGMFIYAKDRPNNCFVDEDYQQ